MLSVIMLSAVFVKVNICEQVFNSAHFRLKYAWGTTTFSIITFSIMTLNINVSFATLSLNDIPHKQYSAYQSVIIPNVTFYLSLCWISVYWVLLCWVSHFIYFYAECRYAECCYAECRGVISEMRQFLPTSLLLFSILWVTQWELILFKTAFYGILLIYKILQPYEQYFKSCKLKYFYNCKSKHLRP
jgi:hypothetical protein